MIGILEEEVSKLAVLVAAKAKRILAEREPILTQPNVIEFPAHRVRPPVQSGGQAA
jgi:hypothetical protein